MTIQPINEFQGQYRFLSNFWPVKVMYEGMQFPSVENAYQAAKTTDMAARIPFMTMDAASAKRAGRGLKIRPEWDQIKVMVMLNLLLQKFRYPQLRAALLATGTQELIEGNRWGDTFWGVDLRTNRGQNKLGMLLMQVRSQLAKESME